MKDKPPLWRGMIFSLPIVALIAMMGQILVTILMSEVIVLMVGLRILKDSERNMKASETADSRISNASLRDDVKPAPFLQYLLI